MTFTPTHTINANGKEIEVEERLVPVAGSPHDRYYKQYYFGDGVAAISVSGAQIEALGLEPVPIEPQVWDCLPTRLADAVWATVRLKDGQRFEGKWWRNAHDVRSNLHYFPRPYVESVELVPVADEAMLERVVSVVVGASPETRDAFRAAMGLDS